MLGLSGRGRHADFFGSEQGVDRRRFTDVGVTNQTDGKLVRSGVVLGSKVGKRGSDTLEQLLQLEHRQDPSSRIVIDLVIEHSLHGVVLGELVKLGSLHVQLLGHLLPQRLSFGRFAILSLQDRLGQSILDFRVLVILVIVLKVFIILVFKVVVSLGDNILLLVFLFLFGIRFRVHVLGGVLILGEFDLFFLAHLPSSLFIRLLLCSGSIEGGEKGVLDVLSVKVIRPSLSREEGEGR